MIDDTHKTATTHDGILVNLGCGPIFVGDSSWINLDFDSQSQYVTSADLLKPLPLVSESAIAVYSSHFIEHVPREHISTVLAECQRILKPGGILRLVLPDFEEMCAAYLMYRQNGEHAKADLLVIEIIDQSVRRYPGGELGKFYRQLQSDKGKYRDMIDFLRVRNGESLLDGSTPQSLIHESSWIRSKHSNSERIRRRFKALKAVLTDLRFQIGIKLLPRPFIRQNVSFATVGELHHWLWDFHQIERELLAAGFKHVVRVNHMTSNINNFPFHPLDADPQDNPRKGAESMYIEAFKVDSV